MINIFGDYIDSKIFFKKLRKFTDEELLLIDNIYNSILREDKNSEITLNYHEQIYDNTEHRSDLISKEFKFKERKHRLSFTKHYCDNKKFIKNLLHTSDTHSWISSNSNEFTDLFTRDMLVDNNMNEAVFITCFRRDIIFDPGNVFEGGFDLDRQMGVLMNYDYNNILTNETTKKFAIFKNNICEQFVKSTG